MVYYKINEMEINTIDSFTAYYEKIREGTKRIIQVIPEDQMDWTYKPGKFTIGDLIRHIAAIERNLFAELILGNPVNYIGCGRELASNYTETVAYFNKMHSESMAIFTALEDKDLRRKIKTVNSTETSIGNFLRALIVHEIHHRAALCIYLNLLEIQTPPVLGLTAEQIITITNKTAY